MENNENIDIDKMWRSLVAGRCGGENFDTPGGGYAFSAILAEERKLEKGNIEGEPSSALIEMSVADPVLKMRIEAVKEGMFYYEQSPDATRYTDLTGIRADNIEGTNKEICDAIKKKHKNLPKGFNKDWVQYSPGSIKRALAEYIPSTFFSDRVLIIFPTPG
ncbi:hypothetical protein AMJ49_06065, partial [Parcubacteria bacterium DG_74_2]